MEFRYVALKRRTGWEYVTPDQAALLSQERRVRTPRGRVRTTASRPVPENPIRVARQYLNEYEANAPTCYGAIARRHCVSRTEVCYHVALIKRLPDDFVNWMETCEDPAALRILTERRLRPITKMRDPEEQAVALSALPVNGSALALRVAPAPTRAGLPQSFPS